MERYNTLKHIVNESGPAGAFTLACACFLAISMTFSPFLLSLGMWGLVAAALWQAYLLRPAAGAENGLAGPWARALKASAQRWAAQPAYILLTLLFFVVLIGGLWSEDRAFWLERLRVRLPFLILPWAFVNLPPLTMRQMKLVLYALIASLVVISIGVGLNFILYYEDIMFGLREGRPVPVPRHHIRFSLILVTGIIVGGRLWAERLSLFDTPLERRVLGGATLFLFVFVHILTVRSALVALYAGLVFSVVYFLYKTRRWKLGLAALCIVATIPALALMAVPSLKQRVSYMMHDWNQYRNNKGEQYSDAERIVSILTGWHLFQENPWLGVGPGDIVKETQNATDRFFPGYSNTPKLPHNQALYVLASTGLFGLALSLPAIFVPLALRRYRRFYLFSVFQVIVLISFLVEYTIETSIGVAFYLFYTLWFMRMAEISR